MNNLLASDPSIYLYDILMINTALQNIFLLVTNTHRILNDEEKLQHVIAVYYCIKQPKK